MPNRFAITEVFDALFGGVSRKTGVATEDYSAIFGGQLYGQTLDTIFDLVMPPAVSGVSQGVIGAGEMLYSTMAEGVNPRLRKELFSMGTKMVMEILDPLTWESKKASAEEVMGKIQSGDIIGALFKTPEEITKIFGQEPKKVVTTKSNVSEVVVPVMEEAANVEESDEEEVWRKLSA